MQRITWKGKILTGLEEMSYKHLEITYIRPKTSAGMQVYEKIVLCSLE